jgi:hypothetical protein
MKKNMLSQTPPQIKIKIPKARDVLASRAPFVVTQVGPAHCPGVMISHTTSPANHRILLLLQFLTLLHPSSSADYGVLFSIFYFHTFLHDSYISHYDTLLTQLIHESLCCPFSINMDIGRLGSVVSL